MKKFLSIVLALAIACGLFSQSAVSLAENTAEPVCSLGNVTVEYGATGVRVPVVIGNNPGVISLMLEIYYARDYFTLKSVEYNSASGFGKTLGNDDYSQYPFRMIVGDDTAKSNNTFNGTIATLVFEINDSAPADLGYDVGVETAFSNGTYTIDANLAPVEFASVYGSIRIVSEPTAVPTDAPSSAATPGSAASDAPGTSSTSTDEPTSNENGTAGTGNTASPGSTAGTGGTGGSEGIADATAGTDVNAGTQPTNVPVTTKEPTAAPDGSDPDDPASTNVPVTDPDDENSDSAGNGGNEEDSNNGGTDGGSGDGDSSDSGKKNDTGCNSTSTAWIVIAVLAVILAAVITAIWLRYKKNSSNAASDTEDKIEKE